MRRQGIPRRRFPFPIDSITSQKRVGVTLPPHSKSRALLPSLDLCY